MRIVNAFWMPTTTLGKWSLGMFISFVIFFYISLAAFSSIIFGEGTSVDTFFDNLNMSVPTFFTGVSGVASFILGAVGILRYKEKSILTAISTMPAVGILFILFIIVWYTNQLLAK